MKDLNWELVEKHLEEAKHKIGAAEHLLKGNYYKDSISRAYYSMFHAAKAALTLRDIKPRTHSGVLSQFGLHFIKEGFVDEMHSKAFSVALEDRGEADYDVFADFTREEAETVLEDAKSFLASVENVIDKIKRESKEKSQ